MDYLKMNLQYFADKEGNGDKDHPGQPEGDGEGEPDNTSNPGDDTPGGENKDAGYTQSDVDRMISKAVEKQQRKFEQEKERIEEEARKQGEAYAKLTEKEKEEAQYSERLEKLEERERELNKKQLRTEVTADLKENKLPEIFAESLILMDDNEAIKKHIDKINEAFNGAVQAEVNDRLKQKTPAASKPGTDITNNPFAKGSENLTEQGRLFKEDPERAKRLQLEARR